MSNDEHDMVTAGNESDVTGLYDAESAASDVVSSISSFENRYTRVMQNAKPFRPPLADVPQHISTSLAIQRGKRHRRIARALPTPFSYETAIFVVTRHRDQPLILRPDSTATTASYVAAAGGRGVQPFRLDLPLCVLRGPMSTSVLIAIVQL